MASRRGPLKARDARGRSVTLLDPLEMHVLRRHDVIEADALAAIADDVGSGFEGSARGLFYAVGIGFVAILLALVLRTVDVVMQGDLRGLLDARTVLPLQGLFGVGFVWVVARQRRFRRVRRVMLRHGRCPHCGYDVSRLEPADDGATVCPECGCAWRVGGRA